MRDFGAIVFTFIWGMGLGFVMALISFVVFETAKEGFRKPKEFWLGALVLVSFYGILLFYFCKIVLEFWSSSFGAAIAFIIMMVGIHREK